MALPIGTQVVLAKRVGTVVSDVLTINGEDMQRVAARFDRAGVEVFPFPVSVLAPNVLPTATVRAVRREISALAND